MAWRTLNQCIGTPGGFGLGFLPLTDHVSRQGGDQTSSAKRVDQHQTINPDVEEDAALPLESQLHE